MVVRMSFDSASLAETLAWLLAAPHVADGGQSFARNFSAKLREAGLPVWRIGFALLAKHPEVLWRTVRWHEMEGVSVAERPHALARETFFKDSPVALLIDGAAPIPIRRGSWKSWTATSTAPLG